MKTIGIDFGTTTTVAATADAGKPAVFELEPGQSVIPSVVAFAPQGETLFGQAAKYRRPIDAENTIFSCKRIIGLPWTAGEVREFAAKYPFALEADSRGVPRFHTRAGDFSAVEVSSKLLAAVLERARATGGAPELVVMGVPADFGSQRRLATIEAMAQAGFDNAVCVDEPLAIARAFLQGDQGRPRRVVVFDLGGGTCDIAVCEVASDRCMLIASAGNAYLGGDDLDIAVTDWAIGEVLRLHQWDISTSFAARTRLLAECERAKIALSRLSEARIKLRAVEHNDLFTDKELVLKRQELDRWALDIARRTFVVCDEVMAQAGLRLDQIDEVFLAGGTTQVAAIKDAIRHYFGTEPRVSPAPDQLVAIGAAVIAQELIHSSAFEATPPGVERRRDLRRKTSLRMRVRPKDLDEVKTLFASDISEGGVFVATDNPPRPGTTLTVTIDLGGAVPGQDTLELEATVVHRVITDRPGAVAGMGLRFAPLAANEQAALDAFVERARHLFGPAKPAPFPRRPPQAEPEK